MSFIINKKELKIQSKKFTAVASRTITSDILVFDDNLKRLIIFIDGNAIIKNYINFCIKDDDNFNIEKIVKEVTEGYGNYIFDSQIDETKEVSYNYQVMKYISDNNINCRTYILPYSSSDDSQDELKGFCDNFVLPFVNYIENNFERIFIEMGLDEETDYNVINNYGGQVNISKDNSTLFAVQNNYKEIDKLVETIRNGINIILDDEIKQEVLDNVEGIQEEIKKEDIKKGKIKSFIYSLQCVIPKIGNTLEIATAITALIEFVQKFIK